MNHDAIGVPLRPSTPQPSGWWSEIWPLALNVVSDRRAELLGQRDHGVHVVAGAVADDDHGPAGAARSA